MPWAIVKAADVRVEEVALALRPGECHSRGRENNPTGHTTRLRWPSPSIGVISGGMLRKEAGELEEELLGWQMPA